jgi:iron complex outermembrane receptor protein
MNMRVGSLARGAGVSMIALVLSTLSATAHADAAAEADNSGTPTSGIAEGSDILVTATRPNEIAPATASLEARQPQSIVSRSFIEDSLPATADFNQIALITPSVSNSGGNNGIGLGESKAQIRGFQDGEFNITYDGIPFGDTNGPTHHSTTFFPSNTVETLVVDRGPGNASQLGAASFGGNINMFSRVARDDFGGELKAGYGSFDTWLVRGLLNSGEIKALGGTKIVLTGQYVDTQGQSSFSPYRNYNLFGKVVVPISADVSLSVLGTYNHNQFNQPDKDGSTLYQQSLYGKYFSLNDNPATPQYYGYNHTTKVTDFEIAKLEAHIAPGSVFENSAYTYYYDNETLSANDITVWDLSTISTTLADGKTKVPGHNPGYTKTNKYRVYGDIAKLQLELTSFAKLTVGAMIEWNDTFRQQTDVDLVTGGFNYIEKKVVAPATGVNPGAVTPLYVKFNQNSNGSNAAEFVELELKPVPSLSITPGFKHVDYTSRIMAAYNQTTRYAQNLSDSWGANLPFLQANWQATSQLAVYGEYARGFLAPSIAQLYVANPAHSTLEPERSTNYQTGVVYHGRKVSFDADIYVIDFNNKFASIPDPFDPTQTAWTNIGGAVYKGVEGQVTWTVTHDVALFANGSLNKAIAKDTRQQIALAPKATAAGGVIFKHGPIHFSLIDKLTGVQYANNATTSDAPAYALYHAYRIPAYNTVVLAASYQYHAFRFGLDVTNLLDSQKVTNITSNSKTPFAAIGLPLPTNFDQYYHQPSRAISGDITFRF